MRKDGRSGVVCLLWLSVVLAGVGLACAGEAMATPARAPVQVSMAPRADNPGCDYYVAPSGQDGNPGTEAQPFRTIARAQDAIRTQNAYMTADIVVCLRGGRYQLSAPVVFEPDDSGSNGYDIVYRAYPGEGVSVSGGQLISGWTHVGGGVYRASVGSLEFRQLYVNGERAIRAREPDGGFHRLVSWDVENRRIKINAAEIGDWDNLDEVEMVIQKHWNHDNLRVASYTMSGSYAYVTPQEPERGLSFNENPPERDGQTYHFVNAYEFLDTAGEWYLNTDTNYVYYRPRSGENMATATVMAPAVETLVRIAGTSTDPVSNLKFYGLTFEHSTWTRPSAYGFVGRQAGHYRWGAIPGAVQVDFARNLTFERNIFRHLGGSGLVLYQGTRDTVVVGNVVVDVSGNGIAIEMRAERDATVEEQCKRDVVRNNYITEIGRDFYGSVGIFGGYPDSAIIEHNEVHDLPYTGISVGWGWTLDDTPLRNNKIRYNRVYDVVNMLDDGGGVYTLSKQPGTLIAENYIHDIIRSPWADLYWISGIYLDNGSDYMTVQDNVISLDLSRYRIARLSISPYLRGEHNTITNNEGYSQAVVDNAGLEPEYQDIRDLVEPPPVPTATPTPTPSLTVTPASRTVVGQMLPVPPAIDGDLSDWTGLQAVWLDVGTADYVHEREVPDPTDASMALRCGWDAEALYFALEMQDDVLVADSDDIWRDDSVELGIDGLYDHIGWGSDDHQFTLNLDGRVTDFGQPTDVVTAVTRTVSGGWVLEVALAAEGLGAGPLTEDKVMGFTFGLHDDDDGGDWDSCLIWEGDSTNDSSAEYGGLLLGPAPPTPTATSTPIPTATPTPTPTAALTPTPTSTPRTVNSYYLPMVHVALQIDGEINEWDAVPAVVLDIGTADYVHQRGAPDPGDARAILRSGWDDGFLYFAIEVHDDTLVADSEDIWRDDSIELGIDGLYDHVGWASDDHQFTFNLDGRITDFRWPTDVVAAVTRTVSGGWTLEVAIEAGGLHAGSLEPGKVMGFTFGLHDDDDGGDWDSCLVWEGNSTNNSSAEYGALVLKLPPATLGGLAWNDADADGTQDVTESGLSGIALSLRHGEGSVVSSTTTDADGFYGFDDLSPGTYTVVAIRPSGYRLTTAAAVVRELEAGEEDPAVRFGFVATTAVALVSFQAHVQPEGVVITWSTFGERGITGFQLQRALSQSGPWLDVTDEPIPARGMIGLVSSYQVVDADVESGFTYYYRLVTTPGMQEFGPILVSVLQVQWEPGLGIQ